MSIECRSCSPAAKPSWSSATARASLRHVGYDPVYGARPLKRAVQKYLQDPLADALLRGEIPDGSTVRVDEGEGGLLLRSGVDLSEPAGRQEAA